MTHDFTLADHGSITILYPVSADAADWVGEHIPDEAQRYAGGVVIEPRYVGDILDGITNDGLSVCHA
jgi:hypothetical protein